MGELCPRLAPMVGSELWETMLEHFHVCDTCGHLVDRPEVYGRRRRPRPHECTPCTCGQPGNRTFMHDLDRAEQETLFLEWVQGLVGKDIVWAEITGSNTGRSCRMQAGYLRSVEAGEPGIPYPCGPEDNHQVPTLRLTLDAAVISAWANGKQDYDGDHLYWYSEIGRDERGGVDLDGQFEWYAFGDWLKEDKGIYWSSSYVPDTSWPVSVA